MAPTLLLVLALLVAGCSADDRLRPPSAKPADAGADGATQDFCSSDDQCPGGACEGGLCEYPDLGPRDSGASHVDSGPGDASTRDLGPADVGPRDAAPGDLGPGPDGALRCTFDTDCPIPYICSRAGLCIPECVEDRDCPAGARCHQGGCRSPGGRCSGQGECLDGEVCHLGRCIVPECMEDRDCPPSMVCRDLACEVPDTGEPDAGPRPEDAGVSDAGPEPGCEPRPGRYGDPCDCQAQCTSSLCLDLQVLGRHPVCTSSCGRLDPCPGIDICLPVGDGEQVCVPNDSGTPCQAPVDCIFACMPDRAGGAVCTVPCDDGGGCPMTWGCGPVGTDQGPMMMCIPAGSMCTSGRQCPGGRCLPHAAGDAVGFCTLDCRNAMDCPRGWSCCVVADPVEGYVRVCYDGPACPVF